MTETDSSPSPVFRHPSINKKTLTTSGARAQRVTRFHLDLPFDFYFAKLSIRSGHLWGADNGACRSPYLPFDFPMGSGRSGSCSRVVFAGRLPLEILSR